MTSYITSCTHEVHVLKVITVYNKLITSLKETYRLSYSSFRAAQSGLKVVHAKQSLEKLCSKVSELKLFNCSV